MKEKIFEGLLKIWAKGKARLRKSKRWESIEALYSLFNSLNEEDDETYDRLNAEMKFLCDAPHIGFCVCIYRYKGILVAIQDIPYVPEVSFYSVVTYKDYMIAKINTFMEKVGQDLLRRFRWSKIEG